MRLTVASLLVAAATFGGLAPAAHAVCGGEPSGPCSCPSEITVPVTGKTVHTGINC